MAFVYSHDRSFFPLASQNLKRLKSLCLPGCHQTLIIIKFKKGHSISDASISDVSI